MTVQKKKGIISSIIVLVFQGWEGIILSCFTLVGALAIIFASPAFAAASLLAKEIFTFLISAIIIGNKNIIKIAKKGFSKEGLRYSIGFVIGSSVGSLFYILAIAKAGSGYGTILTAMYPVFTTIFLRVFFKERTNFKVIGGIIITIFSGMAFIFLPSLLAEGSFDVGKLLGILLGGLTALCWSIEGLVLHSTKNFKTKWTDKELAVWKSFVSLVFILLVIMPITMVFDNSFSIFKTIMTSWKSLLIVLALAINLIITRIAYTFAIRNAGIRTTSIIDTNNFLVTPFISLLIYSFASITYQDGSGVTRDVFESIIWWAWFLIIPIFIGVTMVIVFSNKNENILDHEK